MTAAASDTRFLVLHGLRLKGFGEPPAIGAAVGLDAETVSEHLGKLQAEDLVLHREGRLAGWALTRDGRAEQARLAQDDLATSGTGAVVRNAYERFLALNNAMLTVCTDWQVRDEVSSDHTDAGYDRAVVERLKAIDVELAPILDDLVAVLDRFAGYRPRFTAALERFDAGEHEYFTKPLIDSYHTIWFELHEDLLSSLGIERSQEEGH